MDFELNEIQQMLSRTVADFAGKESPVERSRRLRDDETGWETAIWKQMGELGWLAVPFAEELGGMGGGFIDSALIVEQLGRTLVPEPYVPSVVLAGTCLAQAGTESQQAEFLQPMLAGDTSLAVALSEPANRYNPTWFETAASESGGSWTLSGRKTWVLNGHAANHILVAAATPGGPGLFVVQPGQDGVTVDPFKTIDGRRAAHIELNNVAVSADHVIGTPGEDTQGLLELLGDYGAAAAVAEGVGVIQVMLDMTVEYLKTREQFGVKIGSFQALQHRAVDMFVETQLLRSASTAAMIKADDPDPVERRRAVSTAKLQLGTGGAFVSRQAIQLHGGIGVTDEHDIGLFFKRHHVLSVLFGDQEWHAARFADQPEFIPS